MTYDLYLWGEYWKHLARADGLLRATDFFQRAIARDSSYAPAYTGLADSYDILITYDLQPRPRDIMPKSKAAALRALELDSTASQAHAARWRTSRRNTSDWRLPICISVARSNSIRATPPHHWYSTYLLATGHVTQSLAEIDTARGLDRPRSSFAVQMAFGILWRVIISPAVQQMEPHLKAGAKIPRCHGSDLRTRAAGASAGRYRRPRTGKPPCRRTARSAGSAGDCVT